LTLGATKIFGKNIPTIVKSPIKSHNWEAKSTKLNTQKQHGIARIMQANARLICSLLADSARVQCLAEEH